MARAVRQAPISSERKRRRARSRSSGSFCGRGSGRTWIGSLAVILSDFAPLLLREHRTVEEFDKRRHRFEALHDFGFEFGSGRDFRVEARDQHIALVLQQIDSRMIWLESLWRPRHR